MRNKDFKFKIVAFIFIFSFFYFTGCSDENYENRTALGIIEREKEELDDPLGEDAEIQVGEKELLGYSRAVYQELYEKPNRGLKYGTVAHKSYSYICAKKLGLSDHRAKIIRDASIMPDVFQSGLDNSYNQQWSHAYIITKAFWGAQWVWGDANDDFHDNLDGDSGESESPEGYNEKWAGYYYNQGNTDLGDWYVGYACHFIEDVGFVLHTTFPNLDMANKHFDFEEWMDNNWSTGHNFSKLVGQVSPTTYIKIASPKAAIRNAVMESNYSYSTIGKKAWDNYKKSGFPVVAGSGNSELVYYTGKMVEQTTRNTGGAIRYALDKYKQW